jgi:hypothetical protein
MDQLFLLLKIFTSKDKEENLTFLSAKDLYIMKKTILIQINHTQKKKAIKIIIKA